MIRRCFLVLMFCLAGMGAFSQDLFVLAQSGSAADVQAALKAGAKVDARDARGLTALMYATANPDPGAVAVLLRAGAKVEERNSAGSTPLMFAAKLSANPQVIAALLKAGAKIDARDETGSTALMYAGVNAHPEIVSALLTAGAKADDQNKSGATPLMAAAQGTQDPRAQDGWNQEVISLLLKAGARVDARDANGSTALMYAGVNPEPEVFSVLLKAGARINERNNAGATPLLVAAWLTPEPERVIEVLMQNKAEVTAKDQKGNTVFDYARANKSAIDFTDPDEEPLKDNRVVRAICLYLASSGSPAEVQFALQSGMRVDMELEAGDYLLDVAAARNPNPEVIAVLLKAGARINEGDLLGMTPLMKAARYNPNPEIVSALLKAGADAKKKDLNGHTAFDYGTENEKLKGTRQLQELKKAQF